MSIHNFTAALELLSGEVAEDLQVNTLRTFMFIAGRGECSQKDVEAFLKTSNATTSRNVSYWTDRRFDRQPGAGFVERTIDDHDQRNRILKLTKRGVSFYAKLKGTIS